MKSLITALFILIAACRNNNNLVDQKDSATVELEDVNEVHPDSQFVRWLHGMRLSAVEFTDTVARRALELWAYYELLQDTDSAYWWFPSTDSSYYLLTNYHPENGDRIPGKTEIIEFHFLNVATNVVYNGICFPNFDRKIISIGHLWYDKETLFIMSKDTKTSSLEILKLNMSCDSIWSYSGPKHTNLHDSARRP